MNQQLSLYATKELLADGFPRPTLEEARKWLLEKHGIDCSFPDYYNGYAESHIRKLTEKGFVETGMTGVDSTPEGAMNDAISTVLSLLQNPKPVKTLWQRIASFFGITTENDYERWYKERVEPLIKPI